MGGEGPLGSQDFILRGWLCGQTSLSLCEVLPSHRWTVISDQGCGRSRSVWVRLEGGSPDSPPVSISMPLKPVSLGCGPLPGPGPASPRRSRGPVCGADTSSRHKQVVRRILVFVLNWKFVLVYPGLGEGVIPRSASKGSGKMPSCLFSPASTHDDRG